MPDGPNPTPEEQQLLEMLRASGSPEHAGFDLVARLKALETLAGTLAAQAEESAGEEPRDQEPASQE